MKRLLAVGTGSVLLSLVVVFASSQAMVSSQTVRVRLTRVGNNVYLASRPPTFVYYTRDCTAPAHDSKVTLWLGDTLRFPTGESCYCSSIRPWTRSEDWGVVLRASRPAGAPAPPAGAGDRLPGRRGTEADGWWRVLRLTSEDGQRMRTCRGVDRQEPGRA